MRKACYLCAFLLIMLAVSLPSDASAYWPIVFQVSKNGSNFASRQGPLQVKDAVIGAYLNQSPFSTLVIYNFSLREYDSLREEILKAADVYLQMYPADVKSYEYGRRGEVYFNGEIIKEFSLTQRYAKGKFFVDKSNYRFTQTSLSFPIPMYNYLSNQSLFIRVPVSLLSTNINVTFKMDPHVLWEIYVVSVIMRITPEDVKPWWRENLPLVFGIVLAELIAAGLIVKSRKWQVFQKLTEGK